MLTTNFALTSSIYSSYCKIIILIPYTYIFFTETISITFFNNKIVYSFRINFCGCFFTTFTKVLSPINPFYFSIIITCYIYVPILLACFCNSWKHRRIMVSIIASSSKIYLSLTSVVCLQLYCGISFYCSGINIHCEILYISFFDYTTRLCIRFVNSTI